MRIVVIGGPLSGKSTYSSTYGLPVYCTDPKSLVRNPKPNVTYLPEGLGWSEGSEYVAKNWLTKPGDWIIEGTGAIRALRKWSGSPDQIIYITNMHPSQEPLPGQMAMAISISTMWEDVRKKYEPITKYLKW
jgi:hypothetical protein